MYSYYSQITKKHISEKFPGEIPGIFRVAFRVAQRVVFRFSVLFICNYDAHINHEKASIYQRLTVKSINLLIIRYSIKQGSSPIFRMERVQCFLGSFLFVLHFVLHILKMLVGNVCILLRIIIHRTTINIFKCIV